MTTPSAASPNAPLEGIRVVEIASFVAAPAAGALLRDLGADVVKVEVPRGEIYRHSTPRNSGIRHPFPEAPHFQMDNRGKRSLALDLTREPARKALRQSGTPRSMLTLRATSSVSRRAGRDRVSREAPKGRAIPRPMSVWWSALRSRDGRIIPRSMSRAHRYSRPC